MIFASVFGKTSCCEQFFSKLTLAKTQIRSRLMDSDLKNQLRVRSPSLPVNIRCLAKETVPTITLEVSLTYDQ